MSEIRDRRALMAQESDDPMSLSARLRRARAEKARMGAAAEDEDTDGDDGGLLSEFGAAASGLEVRSPRYMDDAHAAPEAPAQPVAPVGDTSAPSSAPPEKEITEFGFEPFDTPATVTAEAGTGELAAEVAADTALVTEVDELETADVSPLEPAPDHPPTTEEWSTTAPLPESIATQAPDSAPPLPVREPVAEAAPAPEPEPEPAKPKSSGSLFGRADQDEAHRAKANAEDDSEEIAALLAKLRSQK